MLLPDGGKPLQEQGDVSIRFEAAFHRLRRELIADLGEYTSDQTREDRRTIVEEKIKGSDFQTRLLGDFGGADLLKMVGRQQELARVQNRNHPLETASLNRSAPQRAKRQRRKDIGCGLCRCAGLLGATRGRCGSWLAAHTHTPVALLPNSSSASLATQTNMNMYRVLFNVE